MSKPPAKLGTPPPPAKQSDGKTPVWARGIEAPQDWIDREKRRADFVGYLLIGGPLDGDMMSFVNKPGERPIVRLQSTPRPGWPPRSTTGDVSSIDEYRAEFIPTITTDQIRFYRHLSITFAQAVNRLLLWYLPPETRPSLDAQAVQDLAAQLQREEP